MTAKVNTADFAPAAIRIVLFDLAGTTVRDGPPGESLVVRALGETVRGAGAAVPEDELVAERGRDHERAIRELLRRWRPSVAVTDAEVEALFAALSTLRPMPRARSAPLCRT